MTVAQHTARHDVLFAESDAELADVAGSWVGGALAGGAAAVVIATEDHRRAFADRLSSCGIDPDRAVAEGTLLLLDAAATVDRIAPGGSLDRRAFTDVVGTVVRTAGERRPVHAFGEMVGLLWEDGRPQEAIGLEESWDALVREASVSLLCAYPGRLVDDQSRSSELARVCGLHTDVLASSSFERTWRFDDGRGTASAARRLVANAMRVRGAPESLFYDTLTVLTELVANAVQHGSSPIEVGLVLDSGGAVLRVRDGSPSRPLVREHSTRFPTRGLQLVDAVAARWGVDVLEDGKLVWAELG